MGSQAGATLLLRYNTQHHSGSHVTTSHRIGSRMKSKHQMCFNTLQLLYYYVFVTLIDDGFYRW